SASPLLYGLKGRFFTGSTRSRPQGGRDRRKGTREGSTNDRDSDFSGPRHLSGVKTDPVVSSQQGSARAALVISAARDPGVSSHQGSGRWYLARQGDSPGNQQGPGRTFLKSKRSGGVVPPEVGAKLPPPPVPRPPVDQDP